ETAVYSTILEKFTTEADTAITSHTSNITISEKMISSNSSTSTKPSFNLLIHTSIKSSQKPKISVATQSTWHKRLEHSSKIAIQKLANDATGIQITHLEATVDKLTTELCKPCHLCNAENQISRHLHIRSHTSNPAPEPIPEPAGSNVDTGSNVDINPHSAAIDNCTQNSNVDINTHPAAIDNCTRNSNVDINTHLAVIDNHTRA
ncbi:hypothetical protein BDDG_13115, partial [Blastomyces dermatitidis ATCC 18188]